METRRLSVSRKDEAGRGGRKREAGIKPAAGFFLLLAPRSLLPVFFLVLGLLLAEAGLANDETGIPQNLSRARPAFTKSRLEAAPAKPVGSVESRTARDATHRFPMLADRTETKESITYGTDAEMERAMEEQAKEEKRKEEKSWEMLQHMNIYTIQKRPKPPPPDSPPGSQQ